MYKYQLTGYINGQDITPKEFHTREGAMVYLENILELRDVEVYEWFTVGSKHDQRCLCNRCSGFRVNRVSR